MLLTSRKRTPLAGKSVKWLSLMGLTLVISLFAVGCSGSGSSNKSTTPASQQTTVMVTGASGSVIHSSAVTVAIN
jgi:PBP1b-binding outer membrane lipoprotein LpoB